jgi:single-strand DNA-binding protein
MSNTIVVTIFGNLVDEPRHLQTAGGALAKFRVANTTRVQRNGEWVDGETSYWDVTCWRQMADYVVGSFKTGEPVLVHGRLTMRDWATDTKSGRSVELVAEHVGHDLRFGTSLFRRAGKEARVVADVTAFADAPLPAEPPATEDTFAA